MILSFLAVAGGLALLFWSAGKFIDGAAAASRYAGLPPMLIGMVIIGFGTSAPEMAVSAIAAASGAPGLALGNAFGSNIANIGLILGVTALVSPIAVQSRVLRVELPMLTVVTAVAWMLLRDGFLSRLDAVLLLALFAGTMGWTIFQGLRGRDDVLQSDMEEELREASMSLPAALFWTLLGLALLVASSRALVWGAVNIAQALGVSDVVIGLTVAAVGTSLPELASTLSAARKGEHDLALGNVLGSNLFNTLGVVGIAGAIAPAAVAPEVLQRDTPVMMGFTLSLFLLCYGFRGPGSITRKEGGGLLLAWAGYTAYLVVAAV